jgi:hypothetical protein
MAACLRRENGGCKTWMRLHGTERFTAGRSRKAKGRAVLPLNRIDVAFPGLNRGKRMREAFHWPPGACVDSDYAAALVVE